MKICIVTNLYPPLTRGGAEIIAETMAQGLHAKGHDVFVVTSGPYAGFKSLQARSEKRHGIQVYSWYPLNLYQYADGHTKPVIVRCIWHVIDLFNIHSWHQLKKILRREKPDLVITHNLMGIGFLSPVAIRHMHIRHVHVVHDVQLYTPSGIILHGQEHSFIQSLYTAIGYSTVMRWLFKKVELVISPSQFLIDFYVRHRFFSNAKKAVVKNPISFPAQQLYRPQNGRLRLLYIGNLQKAKGAVDLAKTVAQLDDPNITLTLVGTGADTDRIRSLVERSDGRIMLAGRVQHDALPAFFAKADVLVAPTLCYDNFPTVVAESLRHGIPAIVSDLGGAKEIVRNGHNGWVIPVNDWDRLLSLIQELARDRSQIDAAASQAIDSVKELTVDQYSDQLFRLLQK